MLCLRLARGSRPTLLLRGLLFATVSGGVGFLLLATLALALARPDRTTPAVSQLLWCTIPVAATVPLAWSLSRLVTDGALTRALTSTEPGRRPLAGVGATATGLAGLLGSALALLVFLPLGDAVEGLFPDVTAQGPIAAGAPLPGAVAEPLLADGTGTVQGAWSPGWPGGEGAVLDGSVVDGSFLHGRTVETSASWSLPLAGTLTLLAVVPLLGAASALLAHRWRHRHREAANPGSWMLLGSGLLAVGLVTDLVTVRWGSGRGLRLPAGLGTVPVGVLVGWLLAVSGFALAGPGLVGLCGRALACVRPGALRLLAGRSLEADAARLGHPLGLVCASACTVLAGVRLAQGSSDVRLAPLAVFGAGLVVFSVLSTAATAVVRVHRLHAGTRAVMAGFGAPAALLHRATLLRASVLLAVLAPLTWGVAELAALPAR